MSEKFPDSQPVLVPRSSVDGAPRQVEVWHLTDRVNERGRRIAQSQTEQAFTDENGQAQFGILEKGMSEKMYGIDTQTALAEELAGGQVFDKPKLRELTVADDERLARDLGLTPERRELTAADDERLLRDLGGGALARTVEMLGVANTVELLPEVEKEKNPRLKRIFAPNIRPEIPESTEGDDYSHMWLMDDTEHAAALAQLHAKDLVDQPIREAQAQYDRFVNPETRALSVDQLKRSVASDANLRDILEQHSLRGASLDAVDAIRTNQDLRYDVGTYLLNKLNRAVESNPRGYGDRLVTNGQKRSDDHTMFASGTTSREYATSLALAMIDGSFNGDRQRATDSLEHDSNGKIINAQHRDAARSIL